MNDGSATQLDDAVDDAESRSDEGLASPVDYLVASAQNHQIVMLGDRRGVGEHLAIVRDAVGPLYRAGVRHLGWEFTNSRRQDDLDELTLAESWNRSQAIELFVDLLGVGHGYEDYLAIIEAVWSENSTRPDDWPPFRLVALGLPTYVEDPNLLDGRSAGETSLRNWWMGGHYRDVSSWHMANTITAEILRHGERAVIYADATRTNTRFVEWVDGIASLGPGNLLYNWMGGGIARVLFHGAPDDDDALARIEQLVAASPDPETSFGLDLDTSTLGNIRLHDLTGSLGTSHRRLDLGDIADGYLFVQPREDWTPAQLIEDFLGPTTIEVAERSYRALDPRTTPYTLDELEAVRSEGRYSLAEEWPGVPTGPEDAEPPPKRRFRRNR